MLISLINNTIGPIHPMVLCTRILKRDIVAFEFESLKMSEFLSETVLSGSKDQGIFRL